VCKVQASFVGSVASVASVAAGAGKVTCDSNSAVNCTGVAEEASVSVYC